MKGIAYVGMDVHQIEIRMAVVDAKTCPPYTMAGGAES